MDDSIKELCGVIRQTAYEVHCYLRHGHLEKVYENAVAHRLRKAGSHIVQQHPLNVYDEDGTLLGHFVADLFVEHKIVVELKAARSLSDEHVAQPLGYSRAAGLEHGLLCNFGAARFQIRKYANLPDFQSPPAF